MLYTGTTTLLQCGTPQSPPHRPPIVQNVPFFSPIKYQIATSRVVVGVVGHSIHFPVPKQFNQESSNNIFRPFLFIMIVFLINFCFLYLLFKNFFLIMIKFRLGEVCLRAKSGRTTNLTSMKIYSEIYIYIFLLFPEFTYTLK